MTTNTPAIVDRAALEATWQAKLAASPPMHTVEIMRYLYSVAKERLMEIAKSGVARGGYHPLTELVADIATWLAAYPGSEAALTTDQKRRYLELAWRYDDLAREYSAAHDQRIAEYFAKKLHEDIGEAAWQRFVQKVIDDNARTDAALATRYDWYPQEAANE